ncbi:hypothetical protein ABPG73_011429 [Tetrahymena malaccensis]
MIALISIVCCIRLGRQYILDRDTQNVLVKLIIKTMKGYEKGSVTQRLCLAVLHKITLHDELVFLFLKEKLHLWLVDLLKMSISSESQKDNSILKCLDFQNSVQANKFILKSLSYFTKDKFNQAILETSDNEKINQFLDQVSRKTDEDLQNLNMDQKDEYESGMRKKYDESDDSIDYGYDDPDSVIIFEHFKEELIDELLKGVYNRNFDFSPKQLDRLNTSLKKCCELESLVLNLEQECISDDEISTIINYYSWLENLIPNFYDLSNSQRYIDMDFLIKNCGLDKLEIEPNEYEEFLKSSEMINCRNIKILELFELNTLRTQFIDRKNIKKKLYQTSDYDYDILDINLRGCDLTQEGAIMLSQAIKQYSCLLKLTLNLSGSNICDSKLQTLSNALRNQKQIKELNLGLSFNNISGQGIKSLSNSIQDFQGISKLSLNLSSNEINSEGAQVLAQLIKKYQIISCLSLKLEQNEEDFEYNEEYLEIQQGGNVEGQVQKLKANYLQQNLKIQQGGYAQVQQQNMNDNYPETKLKQSFN